MRRGSGTALVHLRSGARRARLLQGRHGWAAQLQDDAGLQCATGIGRTPEDALCNLGEAVALLVSDCSRRRKRA